jgi:uncharacterized protein GlcG (DUF336 family)
LGAILAASASGAWAACSDISFEQLTAAAALVKAGPVEQALTGGLKNNMWVTMVDETGKVCHVVNTAGTGQNSGATWGLSRIISAQKANTSALLSLDTPTVQAWASGALYLATQPVLDPSTGNVSASVGNLQGTLWGVQFSNPVNPAPAYAGNPNQYGTKHDPIKNKRIGGVNVFGGGLALYHNHGGQFHKLGAIGVSGDTSCTDQAFAWRVREKLALVEGLDLATGAQIETANKGVPEILDISGLGYPDCIAAITPKAGIVNGLK